MNYDEYDAGAPAVDLQGSHDDAQAQAQIEQDQAHASQSVAAQADPIPF